ncbi:putative quinol monooxygenase [Mangrovihabitans endophyticus]|uniref:Antibiotic biosynthesis monooxygenase n=1 Tax=Mangrovihabitans endophyticus TaxID=1751298 RepID=A0A8J3FQF4_9ACTN|nr:putative quinol monooxygenase [Mangrovihabitans endophyticus]GGL09168.1 antibiotic biosynthesis monooxygenase [Mangrovihabitans endophyticus]
MAFGYAASMRAQPGKRDDVIKILLSGLDGLRQAGCSVYAVSVEDEDPDMIRIYEVWESAEHHTASLQLPETKAAIATAMPMLTGEFTARHGTVVGGLGVGGLGVA